MRTRALFIANTLDNAYKFQRVLADLDVETIASSIAQYKKLLTPRTDIDLVIFEMQESAREAREEVEMLAQNRECPLLLIADESTIGQVQLPIDAAKDFVMRSAGPTECRARIRKLLGDAGIAGHSEIITVDDMTINLATYQVTVAGEPVDFTYLEYSLLAFLVQHPDRTFSRDALLQSVWESDYYGGSRTVDVHVRRVRAKLGPRRAQHLETVRGFGYLWNSTSK